MNCPKEVGAGAGSGTRTHTVLPPTDFKSVASANSAIPAYINLFLHITQIN